MKFVPPMLSMDVHVKTVHILPLAEHERKFVPRMLIVRLLVFTYTQHAHGIIFENNSKKQNENANFDYK
jgi:hypothetical protein